jgi:hypothetical protein
MKPYRILIVLLLMLTLGACGNAIPTPTGEDVMLAVYTAAAMTFSVQSNLVAALSTPTLVSPPTSFANPHSYRFEYKHFDFHADPVEYTYTRPK